MTSPITLSLKGGHSVRRLRASFDSARTTPENRRHWVNADSLSADSAANADARRTLRNRCRYEVANNSYARGIVLTIANDTIGTGPRLQLLTGSDALNRQVEREFMAWAQAVDLAEKLRTMRMARIQDGEAFAVLATNPRVDHPVQLDLKPVEADQVTSPFGTGLSPESWGLRDNFFNHSSQASSLKSQACEIDGIRLDTWGNPVSYRLLKYHPGDFGLAYTGESLEIPASAMIHLFRQDRPGQHRGIPEIAPALPLFAHLRRFTLAVITAAEAAADFAGVLYTDAPAGGEADNVEPMDLVELERNLLLTLPGGWKMGQVDPKQPATTYGEFKKEILNEIARCVCLPYNIAAGNSSGYNYASGRLDYQSFHKAIRVDQAFMAGKVLDRILRVWLMEYGLVFGFPNDMPSNRDEGARTARGAFANATAHMPAPARCWFWDGMEHVDPAKEAKAQETRLRNNTTTLSAEYAKQGLDWEEALRQRARENNLMRKLGLTERESAPVTEGDEDDG